MKNSEMSGVEEIFDTDHGAVVAVEAYRADRAPSRLCAIVIVFQQEQLTVWVDGETAELRSRRGRWTPAGCVGAARHRCWDKAIGHTHVSAWIRRDQAGAVDGVQFGFFTPHGDARPGHTVQLDRTGHALRLRRVIRDRNDAEEDGGHVS